MAKTYYVYILTNTSRAGLYTGVTGNLPTRIEQHKDGAGSEFTSKYRTTTLVYAKAFKYVNDAIAFEKYLKDGPRRRKIKLIEENNPIGTIYLRRSGNPVEEIATVAPLPRNDK